MIRFLFLILFLTSVSVHADGEILAPITDGDNIGETETADEGTQYAQLKALYNTGQKMDRAEMISGAGWYAGRCYTPAHSTRPVPVVLVKATFTTDSMINGPLFPQKNKIKLAIVAPDSDIDAAAEYSPDFYDNMTEEEIASHEPGIEEILLSYPMATETDTEWKTDTNGIGVTYAFRKWADYTVAKLTNLFGEGEKDEYGIFSTFAYCYFFKKIN